MVKQMIFKGWQNAIYWNYTIPIKVKGGDNHNIHKAYGIFVLGYFVGVMRHIGKDK